MAQISSVKHTAFPLNWQGDSYEVRCLGGSAAKNDEEENNFAILFYTNQIKFGHKYDINCKWEPFRQQILSQWPRLAENEVDAAGPNRSYLATLISAKYGIDYRIIKNYLNNFERSLPLI